MLELTAQETGEVLAKWIVGAATVEGAKAFGQEVGYNYSGFWGVRRRRGRLWGDVVILHSAMAIYAVNRVFEEGDAKPIIDSFLAIAHPSILTPVEKRVPGFKDRYSERLARYFNCTGEPAVMLIGWAYIFVEGLELDPTRSVETQVRCAARMHHALKRVLGVLEQIELATKDDLVAVFARKIRHWPPGQAETALRLVKAVLSGNSGAVDALWGRLTVAQGEEVHRLLEAMELDGT